MAGVWSVSTGVGILEKQIGALYSMLASRLQPAIRKSVKMHIRKEYAGRRAQAMFGMNVCWRLARTLSFDVCVVLCVVSASEAVWVLCSRLWVEVL